MILKNLVEPDELLIMRYLNIRMELTEDEKFYYSNLEKGFEGEKKFDQMAESLKEERFIINSLLLKVNNSHFQIDKLIISQGGIHLLDVKNFQNEFYMKDGKLIAVKTDREWKNPFDQLKRASLLFRQLLQNLKQNYLVESLVIFINPEFTLYQAPMDLPAIFPTQVNGFLKNMNSTPSRLNDRHKKLAQQILSLHQTKNPYAILPNYTYEQQQKGMYCGFCYSFKLSKSYDELVCGKCGGHEKIELAILRHVKEFQLLFPDRKVTTQSIYEWCNGELSRRTFGRVMKKHLTVVGSTSDTFYK
ncbi:MAG: nuclease-related domain-containing protein [Bacillus sp. (in: firmicutes)]